MAAPPPPPAGAQAKPKKSANVTATKPNTKQLLVIAADGNDWVTQFQKCTLQDGTPIVVSQTNWHAFHCEASSGKTRLITRLLGENSKDIEPDFILFRSFPNDLHCTTYRNLVLGLFVSGVGGVNTVEQVLRGIDRPVMHAYMLRIADKLGLENFPVIGLKFHPNLRSGNRLRLIDQEFPTVIKVASSYGGYGKMIAHNRQEYDDLESILALNNEFFTEEQMIKDIDYEFRVQVIGPNVRCFRRNSDNSWKRQQGNVRFEDHEWQEKYAVWVDECRPLFGGMDMFALDVLHCKDGSEFILEINDYAMGFDYAYEPEDLKHVRELVIQRMNEQFCHVEKANYVGQFIFSTIKRGDLKGVTYLP